MCSGSTFLFVKSPSEKRKQTFWTVNIILCIDFPVRCVEFEVCVMKICQCWVFLFTVMWSILTEQADKTPWKLFNDQISVKKKPWKLLYMQTEIFFFSERKVALSSSVVLFLEYLWDDNLSTWQMPFSSKYWIRISADCWSESWWSSFSCKR